LALKIALFAERNALNRRFNRKMELKGLQQVGAYIGQEIGLTLTLGPMALIFALKTGKSCNAPEVLPSIGWLRALGSRVLQGPS
jgi:hypothetical protein